MSETATNILKAALALLPEDRQQLAQQLLDSLDGEGLLPDDPEFYEELARRSDEAHAHPERLLDGKEVMEAARERLRRNREQ